MGLPLEFAPAITCSAKPGAEGKPHKLQFWNNQAPVGRKERQKVTQILRAGNIAKPDRYASLVIGVRGKATMSTKYSSGAVPGDPLGTFPSLGKYLAAAAANSQKTPFRTKFLSELSF